MFNTIRTNVTRKLLELDRWVDETLSAEKTNNDVSSINKGLFFVYIYGIFEDTIREIVVATINEINNNSFKINQCSFGLFPLVFTNEYDALHNVGNDKKWERRWDISNKLINNDIVSIPTDTFPTDGKNIRIRQLKSIANSFGVNCNVLPRPEVGGYVQTMVNNRNDIAHGNKLPKEVGRGYTINDIKKTVKIIKEVCEYTITVYENYIIQQQFIKSK